MVHSLAGQIQIRGDFPGTFPATAKRPLMVWRIRGRLQLAEETRVHGHGAQFSNQGDTPSEPSEFAQSAPTITTVRSLRRDLPLCSSFFSKSVKNSDKTCPKINQNPLTLRAAFQTLFSSVTRMPSQKKNRSPRPGIF